MDWIEILWKVFDYSERLELVHNGCQMSLKMIKHLKWQLDPYSKGFVIMKQQLPYCNYESIVNIKCKHQQVLCISGLKGRKMTDIPSKRARICEEDLILINNVLPPEILKKILEWLDIKNLVIARLTCKRWKLIIDNCDIMEKVLSKISISNEL